MSPLETIRQKFEQLRPVMDERICRLWAAAEAQALGWGGVTLVAQATGVSRKRIGAGRRELRALAGGTAATPRAATRGRRLGGGRCAGPARAFTNWASPSGSRGTPSVMRRYANCSWA